MTRNGLLPTAAAASAILLAVTATSAHAQCATLEQYTDDSARLVTDEVMTAMAERYGDGSGSFEVHFDPGQDYGGPYAFSIPLGRFEEDLDGITVASTARLTVALRHLRSREQIESDELVMRDLELEPGDAVLEEVARAPMGPFGEPYDYREVDGLGDVAILHVDPEWALFVVCGEALMEIGMSRTGVGETIPPDPPPGMTAEEPEIMVDLAQLLMAADP